MDGVLLWRHIARRQILKKDFRLKTAISEQAVIGIADKLDGFVIPAKGKSLAPQPRRGSLLSQQKKRLTRIQLIYVEVAPDDIFAMNPPFLLLMPTG